MINLTCDIVAELNFQIEDLRIGINDRFIVDDFASTNTSEKVLFSCKVILSRLRYFDTVIPSDLTPLQSIEMIYEAIRHRHPPFPCSCDDIQYRILSFLCTHLQVERLCLESNPSSVIIKASDSIRGAQYGFQLNKLSRLLGVDINNVQGKDSSEVVADRVRALVADHINTSSPSSSRRRLLTPCMLSESQTVQLETIADTFQQDFSLRREMLLKRLDVTIESFFRGDKSRVDGEKEQGQGQDARSKLVLLRSQLDPSAIRYSVVDAFSAPTCLMHRLAQGDAPATPTDTDTGTGTGTGTGCMVKRVLIGSVPDRGGRVNEARARVEGGGGSGGFKGQKRGNSHRQQSTTNNEKKHS